MTTQWTDEEWQAFLKAEAKALDEFGKQREAELKALEEEE